jgi:hypothetical protein
MKKHTQKKGRKSKGGSKTERHAEKSKTAKQTEAERGQKKKLQKP